MKQSDDLVAVKSVQKDRLKTEAPRKRLEKECYCMTYLCHPNILRFVEFFWLLVVSLQLESGAPLVFP